MPYLRNKSTSAVVGPLVSDSAEFIYLAAQRSGIQTVWEQVSWAEIGQAGAVSTFSLTAVVSATGAAVSASFLVGAAPVSGRVVSATYSPNAAITGAATNNRTLQVVDVAAGAGTTVLASLNFAAGTNATANTATTLPLQGTAGTLGSIAAGDQIQFQSNAVGTGIADPGGLLIVTFAREA